MQLRFASPDILVLALLPISCTTRLSDARWLLNETGGLAADHSGMAVAPP